MFPFEPDVEPREVAESMDNVIPAEEGGFPKPIGVDVRERRLLCFDYIANVVTARGCPHVLDAKRQYPHWTFVEEQEGRLKRYLTFSNSEPWYRLMEGDWAKGAYKE